MPKEFKGVLPTIIEAIGHTPIVRLNKVVNDCSSTIACKLEYLNPSGSVKDRIAKYMIEQAEKKGELKPGGTIVEATSGNTGMSLAQVAATKGYKTIFVLPDKMSKEKINALRAFGAKVIITPTNVAPDDPRSYYSVAKRLAEATPNAFYANQYHNLDNPQAHYLSTGPEIWEQTQGTLDTLVLGVGTGGTMTGIARYLKEKNPKIKIVGVDPEGSVYYDFFHHKKIVPAHTYKIEGIGEDIFPGTADLKLLDDIVRVEDKESYQMARRLLVQEGIFGGSSSGAAVVGALRYAEKLKKPENILVILPDSGNRYLTKLYNDQWMQDQGWYKSVPLPYGAVEDLISKRFDRGEVIAVTIRTTIGEAIKKMVKEGVSQLPVMDKNHLVGLVNEKNILKSLAMGEVNNKDSVSVVMQTDWVTLQTGTPIEDLFKVFDQSEVGVVFEKEKFLGLITKIDLIKHIGE
ncbi:MAG: cystathionine beta-synthase [Deltaproteobacteria bacterium]|nr:cystathionine beta-synthase [Deltaproteobacteria bacterium]